MNGNDRVLGVVENRAFKTLAPQGGVTKLTGIQMQAAQSPESGEISLEQYEGKAIMVQGHSSSGWIYSASVIDEAGPILTAVVQKQFAQEQFAQE